MPNGPQSRMASPLRTAEDGMMNQADRSDGLRGYDDMVATFVDAGLAPPPVPDNLRSSVRQLRAWCWATRDIDPMAMYLFRDYADEFLAGGADQYFAVCHAGHGVNSYAISLHAVVGRLGVFTQTAWGGVYMDNEAQATLLERQFARVSELFDLIPAESRTHMEDGLLVLQSEFRGMAYCGPIHHQ